MTDETTVTEQPAAEPAPAPIARFVTDVPREKMIPLEWPVDFDGKSWTEIKIRRVNGKQMRDFLEKLRTAERAVMPPMIDCPLEVWEGMDADDQQTIDEAAAEFMPKRMKLLQQAAMALDAAGNQPTK